jgi:hypothetical protein
MSSYKRWASSPFSACRSVRSPVQPELLPAFLTSDRKRVACVIYARDFSPGRTGCAVFLHIVLYVPMQNRSCRISVISVVCACISLYIVPDTATGRKLTTGVESARREGEGGGARNSYGAKTVLSRFDTAKTPIRINRAVRGRASAIRESESAFYAPRLLAFFSPLTRIIQNYDHVQSDS